MNQFDFQFDNLYKIPSRNGLYKEEKFHGTGWRIVNMGELFRYDFINDQEMNLVQLTHEEMRSFSLEDGDLLFGRRSLVEEGAGKCSIVVNPCEPITFESSIIRVRVDKEKVIPRFLFYYFKTRQGRGKIKAIVSGVNVKGIRGSDLKRIILSLSYNDTESQKKVVSIISAYDDLINLNRRRIQLLEESARLLYREWFVYFRFLGHENHKIIDGVPEGWKKGNLEEIASIRKGKNITYETAVEGEVPVVGGGLTPTYYHNIANVSAPVITISASGANAGFVNLYNIDIWASDCSFIDKSSTKFIYSLFLQLKSMQSYITGFQVGAAQPHVYPRDLNRLKLLIPDEELANQFEELAIPIFSLIKNLNFENQKLTQARDLLLPRLMSGEIEVQDASN